MSGKYANKLVSSIDCKQGAVRNIKFNVDGNYCMTCGSDKTLKLWNPFTGVLMKNYSGHGYEVMDADGSCDNSQICSGGMDKNVIVYDVATGKLVHRYRGHVGCVNCVSFNEDSSLVLSGSLDSTVRVWDIRSRKQDPIQIIDDAKDSVTCLIVTDHEIITGCADGRIRRYDIRMGALHTDFIGKAITSMSITRDGACILVSTLDSSIKLMDKESGGMLNEYTGHKNNSYKVSSCITSADTHIISGSEDGNVYIWDLIEAKLVDKLVHKEQAVHGLSYHPTEPKLITIAEKKMYIWESNQ